LGPRNAPISNGEIAMLALYAASITNSAAAYPASFRRAVARPWPPSTDVRPKRRSVRAIAISDPAAYPEARPAPAAAAPPAAMTNAMLAPVSTAASPNTIWNPSEPSCIARYAYR